MAGSLENIVLVLSARYRCGDVITFLWLFSTNGSKRGKIFFSKPLAVHVHAHRLSDKENNHMRIRFTFLAFSRYFHPIKCQGPCQGVQHWPPASGEAWIILREDLFRVSDPPMRLSISAGLHQHMVLFGLIPEHPGIPRLQAGPPGGKCRGKYGHETPASHLLVLDQEAVNRPCFFLYRLRGTAFQTCCFP